MVIASKYGSHPFECFFGRSKGTYQDLWKKISNELPYFSPSVRCVVGEGKVRYF